MLLVAGVYEKETPATTAKHYLLATTSKLDRIAKVRVSFEEIDRFHLVCIGTGVPQYIQSVADVKDVDEAVPDDRVAPYHDLVRAAAQCRILVRDRCERSRREPTGLRWLGWVCNADGLQSTRVPRDEGQVWQYCRVVGRVAGELLCQRIVARAPAE